MINACIVVVTLLRHGCLVMPLVVVERAISVLTFDVHSRSVSLLYHALCLIYRLCCNLPSVPGPLMPSRCFLSLSSSVSSSP